MQKPYIFLDEEKYKNEFEAAYQSSRPFEAGIPLVDISDKCIEEIYYFRWNTYFKHIKKTPAGYVVTEFMPEVPWSGKYNTISCPAGHHFYEGRWIHKKEYLEDYARFWLTDEAAPRQYSFWLADSVYELCKVNGSMSLAAELYEGLKENYAAWEQEKQQDNGLFFQIDGYDGMEYSIGGSGLRPTINSYMYADACALSRIAEFLGKSDEAELYADKAKKIKSKMDALLWDSDACFYKTVQENGEKAEVHELVGYIPWCFNIPDDDKAKAWKFLNDERYFYAPYGPTTAERNHPDFMKEFDHECLWNGPSWPFATTQVLTALANLLCNYEQDVMKKSDYFNLLRQYAGEHYLTEDGTTVPFIDENLDPFTGEWLARKILKENKLPGTIEERGKDYNHSAFCDLVISGIAGAHSREDNICEINPLFDADNLDYFCADGIMYHGHSLCILWDKDGSRYGAGKGFRVYCDGDKVFEAALPQRIEFTLK